MNYGKESMPIERNVRSVEMTTINTHWKSDLQRITNVNYSTFIARYRQNNIYERFLLIYRHIITTGRRQETGKELTELYSKWNVAVVLNSASRLTEWR